MMQNNSRLAVYVLLIGLLSFSCQQKTVLEPQNPVPLSELEQAEQYLSSPTQAPVMFQVAIRNEATGVLSGILVDRTGEIRTYSMPQTPYEFSRYRIDRVEGSLLRGIRDNSEATRTSVDARELARRLRQINRGITRDTDDRRDNSQAEETVAFYVYVANQEGYETNDNTSGCGNTSSHSSSTTSSSSNLYLQVPLHVEGRKNFTNTASYTAETVRWLSTLLPDETK